MTGRHVMGSAALAGVATAAGWILFVGLPRWYGPREAEAPPPAPAVAQVAVRKIKARLLWVPEDGLRLVTVERDVEFGEGTLEQAKKIVEAQLGAAPAPLVSAIPAGTKLRALYVAEGGEAFVDLSREVSAAHPGGSLNEMLTVYTIVNALAVNLPAITAVQILVDGREVDTLAGHVDLRRPLPKDETLLASASGE